MRALTPMSMISPSRLMPSPKRMSNSAVLNGGLTLFLTTLTLPFVVADRLVALLDGADAADVQAHRGVELQRIAAGWWLGLPKPIFMRIWLMKMTMQLVFLIVAVSLRSAWLIRRACRPGSESPISPDYASAATESITIRSTAPERTEANR